MLDGMASREQHTRNSQLTSESCQMVPRKYIKKTWYHCMFRYIYRQAQLTQQYRILGGNIIFSNETFSCLTHRSQSVKHLKT